MMAAFAFRLEKVRQHRKRIVEQHSLTVAESQKVMAHLQIRVAEMETSIARQEQSLAEVGPDDLRLSDLIAKTAWLEHLHRLQEELEQRLASAIEQWAADRRCLTEVWREFEVLSQLRDRQEETWKADRSSRERREMDEIGQVRAFGHGETIVSS